jgi:hypothetical protein
MSADFSDANLVCPHVLDSCISFYVRIRHGLARYDVCFGGHPR